MTSSALTKALIVGLLAACFVFAGLYRCTLSKHEESEQQRRALEEADRTNNDTISRLKAEIRQQEEYAKKKESIKEQAGAKKRKAKNDIRKTADQDETFKSWVDTPLPDASRRLLESQARNKK